MVVMSHISTYLKGLGALSAYIFYFSPLPQFLLTSLATDLRLVPSP